MPKTVILSAARTPIGKLGGGLASLDATELGGTAIEAALERAEVAPEQVEHIVMGQVLQAGQGQIPSRQAQIKAGIPKEVSSETINKVCASGIRSAVLIDTAIRAGDVEVGVGGGMESMSSAPYLLKEARFGFRMGDGKALDAMVHDGLTNPFSGKHMAQEASEVAAELELTRPDMDRWALRSHEWAINEAFASVTLNSIRMLGIDADRVNVNGGAVALGHPIGASGARILGSLVLELRRRGGGLGCAAICSGGGQGDAVIVEVDGG